LEIGEGFMSVSEDEVALAELMTQIIPCAERVRFDVSGTLADQFAIRLARAHTGRTLILKFEGHYHGWSDSAFASVRPSLEAAGPFETPKTVPGSLGQAGTTQDHILVRPFNNLPVLEATMAEHGDRLAAVILEPVPCNTGVIEPDEGYLAALRQQCDRHGIVLIFDEVVTGFRLAMGGAQEHYGVTPDLAVFAKALGGGAPIAMVAGRAEIMDAVEGGVVHGGTYNSNTSAIAACHASVKLLAAADATSFERMRRLGAELMAGLRQAGARVGLPLLADGPGPVFCTVFHDKPLRDYRDYKASDEPMRLAFVQAMQDLGVRITSRGTWFLSTVHTDSDVAETLGKAEQALHLIAASNRRPR
jgi:glutamate-1-semialdehyde 2,1-aminomutase